MSDHTILVIWVMRYFLYTSSVYSCHIFLIFSASVRSIQFLYFIVCLKVCVTILWMAIDTVDVSHKWWDARRKGKKIFLGVFLHPSASLVTLVGNFFLEQDFVTLLRDGFWHDYPLTLGRSSFLCSFRAQALQWDLGSSHNAATI